MSNKIGIVIVSDSLPTQEDWLKLYDHVLLGMRQGSYAAGIQFKAGGVKEVQFYSLEDAARFYRAGLDIISAFPVMI
jgi:hypothetical protein